MIRRTRVAIAVGAVCSARWRVTWRVLSILVEGGRRETTRTERGDDISGAGGGKNARRTAKLSRDRWLGQVVPFGESTQVTDNARS